MILGASLRPRVRRRLLALVIVAAAWTSLAPDSAAAIPGYRLNSSYCKPSRIDSYPPLMYSSYQTNFRNPEQVWWSPDVYKWRPRVRRWRLFRSGAWYYAFSSSYGLYQAPGRTAWHGRDHNDILFALFSGLPRGWYGVKHYMYWSWIDSTYSRWGGSCFVQ